MFHRFKWTPVANDRNRLLAELEPVQPFYLLALADAASCKTFLDIGANVGAYSLFASQLSTVERCLAFEANPTTARELRANVQLNGASIDVVEAAVSDRAGQISFGVVSDFAGDNAVVDTALRYSFSRQISVRSMALDSLSGLPEPLCVKIDVEGHESKVIDGAKNFLRRPCVIQVEDFSNSIGSVLKPMGYFRLTAIGPDHYFSNIKALDGRAVEFYELALAAMLVSIAESTYGPHQVTLRRGDFALEISGKSAARLKKAKRLLGLTYGRDPNAHSSSADPS
jgi:FkbM family methyltransferase